MSRQDFRGREPHRAAETDKPDIPPHLLELASDAITAVLQDRSMRDVSIGRIAGSAFSDTSELSGKEFHAFAMAVNVDPRTEYEGEGQYRLIATSREELDHDPSFVPKPLTKRELEMELDRIRNDPDLKEARRKMLRSSNFGRVSRGRRAKSLVQGKNHGRKADISELIHEAETQ